MKRNDALMAIISSLVTVIPAAAQAFGQQTSEQQTDPLISRDGEIAVYIGVFLIIIAIVAIVRIVSRQIEHTVFTASRLSLIPIAPSSHQSVELRCEQHKPKFGLEKFFTLSKCENFA